MLETYLLIFLTGICVGLLSTLFGIGGGIIIVPLLSLIMPYSHLEAIATSLATIVFVSGFNTYNFSRQKVVVWPIVPWIATASSLFAFISARISTILPEKILVILFLLFLFYTAVRTFLITKDDGQPKTSGFKHILPLGIGTISGLISGVTGIGGGGITTPMMLVGGLVKNTEASPTSNAIMIFTTFFASLSFALADQDPTTAYTLGYIHLDTALLLFAGSASVSNLGVSLNHRLSLFWRKTVLGLLLLFICVRLLFLIL